MRTWSITPSTAGRIECTLLCEEVNTWPFFYAKILTVNFNIDWVGRRDVFAVYKNRETQIVSCWGLSAAPLRWGTACQELLVMAGAYDPPSSWHQTHSPGLHCPLYADSSFPPSHPRTLPPPTNGPLLQTLSTRELVCHTLTLGLQLPHPWLPHPVHPWPKHLDKARKYRGKEEGKKLWISDAEIANSVSSNYIFCNESWLYDLISHFHYGL